MALPCVLGLAFGLVGLVSPYSDTWPARFAVKRQASSCLQLVPTVVDSPVVVPGCFTYRFSELQQATASGVLYTRDGDDQKYRLQMAALNVQGQIGSYDLSFHCPTEAYYGTPITRCQSTHGTQLAVLHVGADNKLYELDIVLSPAKYPPAKSLVANQAAFGIARVSFPSGMPLKTAGYLQVCKQTVRGTCKDTIYPQRRLQVPMPSNVGTGKVSTGPQTPPEDSEWIVDDANQLMAVTAGASRYYFNSVGYYLSEGGTCTASTSRDYTSQRQARDSRFLDYAMTVTVVGHPAFPDNFQPVRVSMWIGAVFDATKMKPVVMYTDEATGYHRGTDTFDVSQLPAAAYGSSQWFDLVSSTVPAQSVQEYVDRMTVLGDPCAPQFAAWLRPTARRTCTKGLVLSGGLCRDLSGRRTMIDAPDTALEMVGFSFQWSVSVALAVALAFVFSVLVAGLLRALRRRHTKAPGPSHPFLPAPSALAMP